MEPVPFLNFHLNIKKPLYFTKPTAKMPCEKCGCVMCKCPCPASLLRLDELRDRLKPLFGVSIINMQLEISTLIVLGNVVYSYFFFFFFN